MAKKKPGGGAPSPDKDEEYFALITTPLRACANYKPKFGRGGKSGLTLDQFRALYQADPFYNWIGLDSPLMYAAHKAAGGMTSVYRQIGIGCQWLFHRLLQDQLGLSADQASWVYEVPVPGRKARPLSLDGRIAFSDIRDARAKARVERWAEAAYGMLLLDSEVRRTMRGVVFEVRQGYKSKDSKRQNADISNAANAYARLYIPILLIFSTQIDSDVAARYVERQWLLLSGATGGAATESTYAFCRDVLGYDLAGFFARTSARFRVEVEAVLQTLLGAN